MRKAGDDIYVNGQWAGKYVPGRGYYSRSDDPINNPIVPYHLSKQLPSSNLKIPGLTTAFSEEPSGKSGGDSESKDPYFKSRRIEDPEAKPISIEEARSGNKGRRLKGAYVEAKPTWDSAAAKDRLESALAKKRMNLQTDDENKRQMALKASQERMKASMLASRAFDKETGRV